MERSSRRAPDPDWPQIPVSAIVAAVDRPEMWIEAEHDLFQPAFGIETHAHLARRQPANSRSKGRSKIYDPQFEITRERVHFRIAYGGMERARCPKIGSRIRKDAAAVLCPFMLLEIDLRHGAERRAQYGFGDRPDSATIFGPEVALAVGPKAVEHEAEPSRLTAALQPVPLAVLPKAAIFRGTA